MRENINIVSLILFTVLALMTACSKPDRNDESVALSEEIVNEGSTNIEYALVRVDSAEEAGVFSAVRANTLKAIIYENASRWRLAAYYAEKAIAAEAGHAVTTSADSNLYSKARWILGDCAYANGEYGKSLALSNEILAFVGDSKMPKDIEMKCRALSQMADCENKLGHIEESERLFLQCIDDLMASTQHATSFGEIDPLIYTLLSLNDLYIDHKMPEKALPLMAKMDTALNRFIRCPNTPDWAMQKRRNNVTISKAMVYAANNQKEQAETLFREYQQFKGPGVLDKAAEGLYLSLTGRYDEAVRLFDETDSMMRSDDEPITDLYVKTLLNYKYDALQKAGRTAEALAMSDRIRLLTDSIRQQERQADVEQLQEINRQEEEIIRKRQSLTIHRIVLVAVILLLLMAIYIIRRVHRDNRRLAEKNRSLYEQKQQRQHAEAEEQRQLEAQPEEKLTQNQLLYRRLCELVKNPDVYTDSDTNHETLARLLGTNYQYVYAALRECADTTPADYLNHLRIQYAAQLLEKTDDPIGLIIEQSGFTNRTTFARLFASYYSMTPSEFRKIAHKQ
ncbi:Helix-turn-helix domain-containing protein [Prevotella sp. ne3005]|uniref:helix-turn-helix transcriptional regulator n=1 Tax=Prevotella sp. ne3005 TaxID=1761887 RepID=UPI0008B23CAC|nr:helix-turn-helix transcriptional regulator [Prevotella sp. ne3005]SEM86705.1 Helix-turn-helix domain-containing protein [Prevotella sp. ne3005]